MRIKQEIISIEEYNKLLIAIKRCLTRLIGFLSAVIFSFIVVPLLVMMVCIALAAICIGLSLWLGSFLVDNFAH